MVRWKKNIFRKYMCIPFLFTTAMIAKLQLNQKRQIDTHCTQIHDRSLCWIDTDSSIKIDWVKLVFVCAQTCPLCEKICSCKCFPHVSKMPTLTSELNIRCVRSRNDNQFQTHIDNFARSCNMLWKLMATAFNLKIWSNKCTNKYQI